MRRPTNPHPPVTRTVSLIKERTAEGSDTGAKEPFEGTRGGLLAPASSIEFTTILFYAPSVQEAVVLMEGQDRRVVLIGVLCVLVSVSLGTVFALGPLGPVGEPLDEYVADWYTQTGTVGRSGTNDQVVDLNVREANMTSLTVRLTWTDDELVSPLGRRDDQLTLRVVGPSGTGVDETVSGTTGDLVLEFDLATVPTDREASHLGDYLDENATGQWSITVSVEARGFRDTGNDWSVSFAYTYYVGRLIDNPEVV